MNHAVSPPPPTPVGPTVTVDLAAILRNALDLSIPQVLDNLLVGAIEGGSTYWAGRCVKTPTLQRYSGTPWYENAFVDGLTMTLTESDEDGADEADHPLNLEKGIAGLRLMAEKHPRHFSNLVIGNDDAETADVWLQLTVLGEIKYG